MSERKRKRQVDMDLRSKIKEMESKKREEQAQIVAKPDSTMSFDQWWMGASKKLKLKQHLKEILWADFQARGLKKEATSEQYDAACRLFGYSI